LNTENNHMQVERIELRYTPKDLAGALYRAVLRKKAVDKWSVRAIDALLFGLAFGLLVQMDFWIRLATGVLAAAWYFAGSHHLRRWWVLWRLGKFSKKAMHGKSEEISYVEVRPEGLWTLQKGKEELYSYDQITEFWEYEVGMDLLFQTGGALVVLRKCFANDHQYEQFASDLEKKAGRKADPAWETR
jgi:hypothetical protein